MDMNISKTYSETIGRNFQSWKYTSTLTRSVNVNSAKELEAESLKLWKQVQLLTQKDIKADEVHREKAIALSYAEVR